MYKDTRKRDKRVKTLAIIFIVIIFILMFIVFIYETMIKKADYVDVWGEEKEEENIEYIEDELHPTIQNADNYNIINKGIEKSENNYDEDDEQKNRRSGYHSVDADIPSSSYLKRYIDTEHTILTPSNANDKSVPNYHTWRIFYKDLNSE